MSELYVHATLKIKHGGGFERFCEAKAKQVPVLEGYGWKLVGGWGTIFGRVYTIVNVWQVPTADVFLETAAKWRASPEGKAFRMVTAEVVEEEVVTLMKSLPYSK
jgi:hypothetical protein